jgi:rhodanese-related sulfurtransferase
MEAELTMMRLHSCSTASVVLTLLTGMALNVPAWAADRTNLKTVTPEEVLRTLAMHSSSRRPLLFQVGSHMLYVQAHIPGSEYLGPAASPEGVQNLRNRVANLARSRPIVLYCGCCPWSHCPNVNPAYDALLQLGFTNVKVLYMANNFGADWVDKGYPVARGD